MRLIDTLGMIVVGGEALVDMIPAAVEGACTEFKAVPGGSPFNVAVALGRLECQARFFCGFAEDAFGRILLDRLQDAGVDLAYCMDADGLTTLGFVSEGPHGTPEYAFYTSGTAGCSLTKEQVPAELPDEVGAIHFGSFALGVEPFGTALEVLCQRESSRRFISLDPNIRPFLVQDRTSYLARLERFQGVADLIKTSVEDLAWTTPGLDLEEFAQQRLAAGAGMVVVTRGEEGALGFCRQGQVTVPGEKVSVVDTVGAGDTFQATLLAGLAEIGRLSKESIQNLQTSELERLIRRAGHAAAINCSRQGCDPPSLKEIGTLAQLR